MPMHRGSTASALTGYFGLFLLPGGRPLRFTSDIHFGGRPRPRLPRLRAMRSRTRMVSSMPSLIAKIF